MSIIGHSMTDKEKIRKIINKRGSRIYFIGIGGISTSALALMAMERGLLVYGSDVRKSEITENLRAKGTRIEYSHTKAALMTASPDIVVYSLSIREDNPEYALARSLGILCVSRAELLGAVMADYRISIGVSGSHGKSTVTAMLSAIFDKAGLEPTTLCGAEISHGSGYKPGKTDYLIYEACEYGDSFLHFKPSLQLFLNLDLDHTDYFGSEEKIRSSFAKAANLSGVCVISSDSGNLRKILPCINSEKLVYSNESGFLYRYEIISENRGKYSFDLYERGEKIGRFCLNVFGRHNVENAVGAVIASIRLGISAEIIRDALLEYSGIPRRMEFLCGSDYGDAYYDYAHHPREIKATREALESAGYKRISVIFSPHTYSRTKAFMNEFAEELSKFASVYITDIFGAREQCISGVSSQALAERIRELGRKNAFAVTKDELELLVKKSESDSIVIMGAGDNSFAKEMILKSKR